MEFVRMGLNSAQPRFQVKGEGMIDGKDLCIFEVARDVVGIEAAKKPGSGVYRKDIVGFNHADAKLIAAAPCLLEALIKLHESLTQLNDSGDAGQLVADEVETARAAIEKATA
jgi:hypothetical protein